MGCYEDYVVPKTEVGRFGLTTVRAYTEGQLGYIINHTSSGLLAADRLVIRRNAIQRTDDGMVISMTEVARAKAASEHLSHQASVEQLIEIVLDLPKRGVMSREQRARYAKVLGSIVGEEAWAINTAKRGAVQELTDALVLLEKRGHRVPGLLAEHLTRAVGGLTQRQQQLVAQLGHRKFERTLLSYHMGADRANQKELSAVAQTWPTIAEAGEEFLMPARRRVTKPGALTVNNVQWHSSEPDSGMLLQVSQAVFEPLYSELMAPLSRLRHQTIKKLEAFIEVTQAFYVVELNRVDDLLDLIMLGWDFDALVERLRQILYVAQQAILDADFSVARKAAAGFCFLLRYRAMPGEPPPPQWYSGLSAAPAKGRIRIPDDPWEGLPT